MINTFKILEDIILRQNYEYRFWKEEFTILNEKYDTLDAKDALLCEIYRIKINEAKFKFRAKLRKILLIWIALTIIMIMMII